MQKAGVIGVGSMGKNHARVYSDIDSADLVAIADPNKELVEKIAAKYHINAYTDYKEMLEKEALDIVSVVVPTTLHKQVSFDVIDQGVNLLLEKPIASTREEAQDIIKKAEEKGVKLAIGHIERFNPAVIELKRRLEAGELGRLYKMHARRVGPFPSRIRDVGVVIDLAVHDLDMMSYLMGSELKRVYAEAEQKINTEHEDMLNGVLKFKNDTLGVLSINWLTPTKIREFSITGEKGMFVVNQLTQDLYFHENALLKESNEKSYSDIIMGVSEGNMTRIKINKKEPLRAELESFIDSVHNDKPVTVTGEDGLKALEMAHLLIESAKRKEVIKLE